jgi:hypothetical protein
MTDASVMPSIISGPTNAPAFMIGAGADRERRHPILESSVHIVTASEPRAKKQLLELITDERNCFNKSLASLIREKSPQKVPKAEKKTG